MRAQPEHMEGLTTSISGSCTGGGARSSPSRSGTSMSISKHSLRAFPCVLHNDLDHQSPYPIACCLSILMWNTMLKIDVTGCACALKMQDDERDAMFHKVHASQVYSKNEVACVGPDGVLQLWGGNACQHVPDALRERRKLDHLVPQQGAQPLVAVHQIRLIGHLHPVWSASIHMQGPPSACEQACAHTHCADAHVLQGYRWPSRLVEPCTGGG